MNAIRGSTLPETAMMLAISLLLLLGILQLGIIGWTQSSAQAAAFVAAHAISIDPQGSQSGDQALAQSVIASPFPNVLPGDLNVSYPNGASVQVTVDKAPGGLLMVPNSAAAVAVRGVDIEPVYLSTPSSLSPFAVSARLKNYCTGAGSCNANYSLYIAQYDDLNGTGNGKNGQFGEWKCRPGLYYNFPNSMPAKSAQYDPASPTFVEKQLYAFDTQSSLWGVKSSC